eukprot:TRINITY_DN11215_c0_g3_i1.p1 TRINITY_DN11215_c0_g3~~TRINITY_DN11215_c0_g3_i1.p1  ORF type:complete len:663 (+),score=171.80 TRINITY_DN11215_c0_g3_i1:63-2051(+)
MQRAPIPRVRRRCSSACRCRCRRRRGRRRRRLLVACSAHLAAAAAPHCPLRLLPLLLALPWESSAVSLDTSSGFACYEFSTQITRQGSETPDCDLRASTAFAAGGKQLVSLRPPTAQQNEKTICIFSYADGGLASAPTGVADMPDSWPADAACHGGSGGTPGFNSVVKETLTNQPLYIRDPQQMGSAMWKVFVKTNQGTTLEFEAAGPLGPPAPPTAPPSAAPSAPPAPPGAGPSVSPSAPPVPPAGASPSSAPSAPPAPPVLPGVQDLCSCQDAGAVSVCMTMKPTEKPPHFVLTLTGPANAWFAFGIGGSPAQSGAARMDGVWAVVLHPGVAKGKSPPAYMLSSSGRSDFRDATLGASLPSVADSTENGRRSVTVYRELKTQTPNDVDVAPDTTSLPFVTACGKCSTDTPDTTFQQAHGSADRTSGVSLDFSACSPPPPFPPPASPPPAPPPPPPPLPPSEDSGGLGMGALIGIIAGGVVLVAAIVVAVICYRKKKRKRAKKKRKGDQKRAAKDNPDAAEPMLGEMEEKSDAGSPEPKRPSPPPTPAPEEAKAEAKEPESASSDSVGSEGKADPGDLGLSRDPPPSTRRPLPNLGDPDPFDPREDPELQQLRALLRQRGMQAEKVRSDNIRLGEAVEDMALEVRRARVKKKLPLPEDIEL